MIIFCLMSPTTWPSTYGVCLVQITLNAINGQQPLDLSPRECKPYGSCTSHFIYGALLFNISSCSHSDIHVTILSSFLTQIICSRQLAAMCGWVISMLTTLTKVSMHVDIHLYYEPNHYRGNSSNIIMLWKLLF